MPICEPALVAWTLPPGLGTSLPPLLLRADGAGTVAAEVPLGERHRGAERRLGELTWNQAAVALARIDPIGSGVRDVAFARVVELLTGAEVSPRAAALRDVYVALDQLSAATGYFAALADLRGGSTLGAACRTARERVLDVLEQWTGARIHHDLCAEGGLRADVDGQWVLSAGALAEELWRWARLVDDRLVSSRTWQADTRALAVLDHRDALALGVTGASLRASAGGHGDRPGHSDGDVFARVWVRLQDVRWHCRRLRRRLDDLPAGPISALAVGGPRFAELVPAGEASVEVEHAGGAFGLLVVSDGGPLPWRIRVASPSVPAAAAAARLAADVPGELAELVLLSLWPLWGEAAR